MNRLHAISYLLKKFVRVGWRQERSVAVKHIEDLGLVTQDDSHHLTDAGANTAI